MIETKRLFIKPLTEDELKKHINSPDIFARELGLSPSESLMNDENERSCLK